MCPAFELRKCQGQEEERQKTLGGVSRYFNMLKFF